MKISIITEGFQNTGYGHVTRCFSLYQAFEDRYFSPKLFINGDSSVKNILTGSNFLLIDWLKHPAQLFNEVKSSEITIIDSYIASKEFYEALKKISSVCLFIDDTMRIDYPDGFILNSAVNAEFTNYETHPKQFLLVGTKYTPLRKEFWKVENRKVAQKINHIMLTLGGFDSKNIAPNIIRLLKEKYPSVKKTIVGGFDLSDHSSLLKYKDEQTEILLSLNGSQMRDLMVSCDVAISAAGQTLYELAVTGTPTIAIAVAENQRNNILGWKKNGFLIDPIFHSDVNFIRKIADQLEAFESISIRKKVSASGRTNIDGLGANRVINKLIESYCHSNKFYLRKAVASDSQKVFELSNEFSVRQQSINKEQIELHEHNKWFNEKINSEDYIFLLAFDNDDNFIGQIRFDIKNTNAIVSISVAPQFRGKGLSKRMLSLACKKAFNEYAPLKNITAYILPDNSPSIKTFESCGFKYVEKVSIKNEVFLKYILERE